MYRINILNAQRDSGESNPNNQIPRHLVTIRDALSKEVLVQHYTVADPRVFDDTDGVPSYRSSDLVESRLIDIQIDNIALFRSRVSFRPFYMSIDGLPEEDIGNGTYGAILETQTTAYEGERYYIRNVLMRDRYALFIESYNYDSDSTDNENVLGIRGLGTVVEGYSVVGGVTVENGQEMFPEIQLYRISTGEGLISLPNSNAWADGELRPTEYYLPPTGVIIPTPPPPPPPAPTKDPVIPDSPVPFAIMSDYVFQLTPWHRRQPKWLALLRTLFQPMQTLIDNWSIFEQKLISDSNKDGTTANLQYYLNRELEYAQGTILIQNQALGGFKVLVPAVFSAQERQLIKNYVENHKIAGVSFSIENKT